MLIIVIQILSALLSLIKVQYNRQIIYKKDKHKTKNSWEHNLKYDSFITVLTPTLTAS